MFRKAFQLASVMGLVLLFAPPQAEGVIHNITVGNSFFSPPGTTVQPGDTVRWTWAGGIPHSTTSDVSSPKSWNSGITSVGGFEFDVVFSAEDAPGPFPYHCAVHALTMKDTIHMVLPPSCCEGVTGNVDGDANEIVDIGDLTALIAFLFIPPNPVPECLAEANTDGDENGIVDIGDLTSLIAFLFIPPNTPLADCQ